MKKIWQFVRSMKFGMLLLFIIAILSVAGTLIPQEQETEAYEAAYGGGAKIILFLGFDHLYSTWYYIGLFALLGLSLLFCSVMRFGRVKRARQNLLAGAEHAGELDGFAAEDPEAVLKKNGFRRYKDGWIRGSVGLYGSFVTHLAMLLLLIACACIFLFQEKKDYYARIGQAFELDDGTLLHVDDFSLENEEDGELDYRSGLTAVLPDKTVVQGTVRVNHPRYFGRYKVYQQSYAFDGIVDIKTSEDGQEERALLTSGAFLTLDGENGISYMESFGTYTITEDGQVLPQGYADASGETAEGYMIAVTENGTNTLTLAKVDEPVVVGGVWYTFRSPQAFPGLRVKTLPAFALPFLYTSFVLLIAGLYLCFFCSSCAAVVRGNRIALKTTGDSHMLERRLREAPENKDEADSAEQTDTPGNADTPDNMEKTDDTDKTDTE